ncbi:nitrous oxide reductase accessory protein NosL [Halobacterium litoreum]|uniref:Nitrous oxide reductase accessory protein NosL n=1 Tax=Halobacterium litoreum TaxID=2039234 RepID=A0ABD5NEE6_9EURY|nr:nitrous oxide reductase accessory protein NosL [Halobacterium litoreum]UHH13443.1 nitrous oxide reductase accessory protein NosL [Halobacterium litoreum]
MCKDDTTHDQSPGTASTDCTERGVTRRRVLQGASAAGVAGLAGCLSSSGGGDDAPEPVTLGESATCDVCGMVIPNHPGPTAEIFYADEQPSGHDNPARFDSTWEAFQYDFEHDDWDREAFYVTDYSAVDYEIRTDGGQKLISTHPTAEAFADAEDVTFVVGSDVVGAMGRDLVAFGDEADAEAFADEHGGKLASFGDVTPTMIASLGM